MWLCQYRDSGARELKSTAVDASMFKQPRKTLCSDNRFTLDDLHDRIYARLPTQEAKNEYLLLVGDFFSIHDTNDDATKGRTFQRFAQIVQPYLTNAEQTKIVVNLIDDNDDKSTCKECGNDSFVEDCGYRICNTCGVTIPWQCNTRASLSYNDTREEVHVYPYRRANHFQEWLIQCQAKQSTDIAEDVFDQIRAEMRKRRLTEDELNSTNLKSIMKPLKLNKYYEHIAYILYRMTGTAPLRLSLEVEERMKQMFAQIQAPFDKVVVHVAPKRKNFLSYSFVLRKFAELMELDDIIESFPLLKSREKLHVQDAIWKAICEELNWRFIPSI